MEAIIQSKTNIKYNHQPHARVNTDHMIGNKHYKLIKTNK